MADPRIVLEQATHLGAINALLDDNFGPERMARAVYRLREGVPPEAQVCFVHLDDAGEVAGMLRYWRVMIGDNPNPALLLGPIAIHEEKQNRGKGARLIRHSLKLAAELGYQMVYLIGDEAYYGQFGFTKPAAQNVTYAALEPGKIILGLEIVKNASHDYAGEMRRDNTALAEQVKLFQP